MTCYRLDYLVAISNPLLDTCNNLGCLRDGSFGIRSLVDKNTSALSALLKQFMNVVIKWECPDDDRAANPLVFV